MYILFLSTVPIQSHGISPYPTQLGHYSESEIAVAMKVNILQVIGPIDLQMKLIEFVSLTTLPFVVITICFKRKLTHQVSGITPNTFTPY